MEAVTELKQSSQSKKLNFFVFSRVSPGAHPLIKKPEDSGYEIRWVTKCILCMVAKPNIRFIKKNVHISLRKCLLAPWLILTVIFYVMLINVSCPHIRLVACF